ncbi:MAG: hypothetical protein LCH67_16870 [Bacteroidetes bacterium]|nr:hypothetical protein [Bacteroidota bacterium]
MKSPFLYIVPLALISLILGVIGGWIRLGWGISLFNPVPVSQHGVFMVGGFLGTLVSLERVVTFHKPALFLIPFSFGISVLTFLTGHAPVSHILLMAGSIGYLVVCFVIFRKFKNEGDFLLALGAVFQFTGHFVLYKTQSYPMAFAAWMLFFLFTIVGERLELSRFLPRKKYQKTELYFWLISISVSSALYHYGSSFILNISLIGLATWLLRNDISIINLKKQGSYKFLGISLLAGFCWLIITGLLGFSESPLKYDALLHAFFIGFVLNMILAHAPVIFPAMLKINFKPFHPIFYLWLTLLNLSLLMRISGDLFTNNSIRITGGLLNGLSFAGYLVNVAILIIKHQIYEKNYKIRSI